MLRLTAYLLLFMTATLSYAKTLVVAVPEFNPPFIMPSGSGHLIGFDADIMNEVCRRIAVECKFKTLAYGQLFNAVRDKEADVAIGALTISLARDKEFLFSLPYLQSFGQFIINNKSNIQSTKDLANKKFGMLNHSVYKNVLIAMFGSKLDILIYDFQAQMLTALHNNEVDVLLMDKGTADYWYANSDNIYRLLGKRIPYGYGYGILAAKGQEVLISEINAALLTIQADGTYVRIYSTYFSGGVL